MSEPTTPSSPGSSKPIDPSQATTQISYCPHLDIYNYKRVDGEYFFDTPALEASIETYQTTGDLRQAEFMAALTSFARKFPHKVVTIFPDMSFEIRKLNPRKFSGEEEKVGEEGEEHGDPKEGSAEEDKKKPMIKEVGGSGES